MTESPKPEANIRFRYAMCNDVKEMKNFYTDVLGMQEASFLNEKDWGWLVKDSMGNTIEIYAAPIKEPEEEEPVWKDS